MKEAASMKDFVGFHIASKQYGLRFQNKKGLYKFFKNDLEATLVNKLTQVCGSAKIIVI